MKRCALPAAVLLALFVPAAAHAQGIFIGIPDGTPQIVSATDTSLKVSGALAVEFHGDEAAGCADAGVCGVSGEALWRPGRRGALSALAYLDHGRRLELTFAVIGEDQEPGDGKPPSTSARVRRTTPDGGSALCVDASSAREVFFGSGPLTGGRVSLGLLGDPTEGLGAGEVLRTRCAGPTTEDVRRALPVHTLTERAIRRGRGRVLDYSVEAPFNAGGFSGTVHSTIKMRIGRSQDSLELGEPEPSEPTKVVRRRELDVTYRIESFEGRTVTSLRGLADPDLCGPLDSCGLMGQVTVAPRIGAGEVDISASAPLRISAHDLRRAVGLAPGGRPRGVKTFGFAAWDASNGSVTSELQRDGALACTDVQGIRGPNAMPIDLGRSRVRALYGQEGSVSTTTRCPGPVTGDVAGARAIASGSAPLRALGRRRVTLRLRHGHAFSGDGYTGSTSADLALVMRRASVRSGVITYHVPVDFPSGLFRRSAMSRMLRHAPVRLRAALLRRLPH
jgi:hypothetical protein